jgi:phosphate:Na+ symporter
MIELGNSYFILLLGGIALFHYGMTLAGQSLEKLLASRISMLMNKVSDNNFLSIVVGISLTTLLQSSGAVTSMLVGLGSARVITLRQVMGVIIGTAVGSTLTVQLISLNLATVALPVFIVAFAFYYQSKKTGVKNLALALIGFSFLFIGMKLMGDSARHFVENPTFSDVFKVLRENPGYSLVASILFCAFVHSSAVTIGLSMSLAAANAISLDDAMIWVYGANIGTTSTALIAASGSNYIGKQVAWAHFFYKTISVLIFYPATSVFLRFLESFDTSASRVVANGHLVFNLISAALFFPFINKGAELIQKMFPKGPQDEFGADYLRMNNYQSSSLATSYAQREIMRTADIVLSMIVDSLKLFQDSDPTLIESIKDRDNKVDFLYRETKMFLLDQANKSTTAVQQNILNMIMFISDLERAADAIDINVIALAVKKHALKLEFSDEGWQEICKMHSQTVKVANMAINAYQTKELCVETIGLKRELAKLEINLRENHIGRLNRGLRDSINTSSIHLDLLSEYRRIASLLANHAYNNLPKV